MGVELLITRRSGICLKCSINISKKLRYQLLLRNSREARELRKYIRRIEKELAALGYCMKTQIFNDGNKRAAVIFANHSMITKGQGLLVIPQEHVPEFTRLLVAYYEGRDNGEITEFMHSLCWRAF